MTILEITAQNLRDRGYAVRVFATRQEAAAYLNESIDGTSVGFGGSGTLERMGLFESLGRHNTVYWHWKQEKSAARASAAGAAVYLTSANALAQTGELINIDGLGNRVASTLFGHPRVCFVVGRNKIAPTYDEALWRARNVAAPKRAQQMGRKTPCALKADRCYDCKSPDRICRGLVVLWKPMLDTETEVLLVDEELGN